MTRQRGLALTLLAAAAVALPGETSGAATTRQAPTISEWRLPNGLTVAHVERPGLPMVTVQVWVKFGSRNEPVGQRGSARVFERLMFQGSERVRPGDHERFVKLAGGQTSALTTEDVTAYHNTVPTDYLDLALELESERMRKLLFRAEAVDAVRAQVAEETRRQESSPLYRAYLQLLAGAFAGSPYSWAPTGVRSEIDGISPVGLKLLYDAHYQPNNALVVIVGGVPADVAKRSVERWFGPLVKAADPKQAAAPAAPKDTKPSRHELTASPVGLVMAGYRLPEAAHADMAALQIAGMLLTAGPSSRLHKKLVDGKLADEIGGQVLVREAGGLLVTYARLPPGADLAAVEKTFVGEVERLATQGPTPAELKRARGQVLGAALFGTESTTGLANQIGVSWTLTGKAASFLDDLGAIEKVTPAAVKTAAATYLSRGAAHVVVARASGGGK